MKYSFKHVVEYAALRAVSGLACAVPYRVALGMAWLIAWLAFYVFRFRVADAKHRIREVFAGRFCNREVNRIAWVSLRNTAFGGIEMMRIPRTSDDWCRNAYDRAALERCVRTIGDGAGAVFALPHTGNWEMAGIAAKACGVPVFYITGHQKNPLADAWMNRVRGCTGIETIPRDSSVLKKVIRNLKKGKILAMLTDLRARAPALPVHFLGKEANLVGGTGMFARQADVAVYPVIVRREGWTRHTWEFCEPVRPDPNLAKKEDWLRITRHVIDLFDAAIRAQPEQFFWYNKRWVLDPLDPEPDS